MTRIKMCGFTREQDVEAAIELGIHAVGFVLEASSPRHVELSVAQRLARLAEPYCISVAVYGTVVDETPATMAIQAFDFAGRLPARAIGVLRVTDKTLMAEVNLCHLECASLLLDAYSPTQHGGTGIPVDWRIAADMIRLSKRPIILAGGLKPDNVAEAIGIVRPYGVDVSSGIEVRPGIKDVGAMRAFVEAVREADENL